MHRIAVGFLVVLCLAGCSSAGMDATLSFGGRDPVCYPVLNGTMGYNGFFISPVQVSFVYNEEVVVIQYNCGDGIQNYTEPFVISQQGSIYVIYWFLDTNGSWSLPHTISMNIDTTPPVLLVDLVLGIHSITVTASTMDEISGVLGVEFYFMDVLQFYDTESPYLWMLTPFRYRGDEYRFGVWAFDLAGNRNRTEIFLKHVHGLAICLGQTHETYRYYAIALKMGSQWSRLEFIDLPKNHNGHLGITYVNGYFVFEDV